MTNKKVDHIKYLYINEKACLCSAWLVLRTWRIPAGLYATAPFCVDVVEPAAPACDRQPATADALRDI